MKILTQLKNFNPGQETRQTMFASLNLSGVSLIGGNTMTYAEAMKTTVTRDEAESEIERQGCDFQEFLKDFGDKPRYSGKKVLEWLGW